MTKEQAINECTNFLNYYPFRYVAIVSIDGIKWDWVQGKTKARMNNLARKGYEAYFIKRGH